MSETQSPLQNQYRDKCLKALHRALFQGIQEAEPTAIAHQVVAEVGVRDLAESLHPLSPHHRAMVLAVFWHARTVAEYFDTLPKEGEF